MLGKLKCLLGALALFFHPGVDAFAPLWHDVVDKLKIVLISHNYVGLLYCLEYSGCYVVFAARAYACYYYLSHINCKDKIII